VPPPPPLLSEEEKEEDEASAALMSVARPTKLATEACMWLNAMA
jgi:hypothetical protein